MAPRILPLTALAAALACISPSMAGAVTVAAGPDGRALVTWGNDLGTQLIERSPAGVSPAATISSPEVYPLLGAWGPGGAATVLAFDQSDLALRKLVVLRRGAGVGSFAPPQVLAQAPTLIPGAAAANERGDVAALAQRAFAPPLLVTAAAGQAFTPAQALTETPVGAAIAVGGGGRVLVAYPDHRRNGVYARVGSAGSPLGAAVRVAARRSIRDIAAAVDAAGNATIAFVRSGGSRAPEQLVAARARPGQRFTAPVVLATGGPPQMGGGFSAVKAAAAGTTTALAWGSSATTHYGAIDVAVARGGGRFGVPRRASAPPRGPSGIHGYAGGPSLAVDRAGDVLVTYSYGYSVHAALRRAGNTGFGAPRSMSTLQTAALADGEPGAALLSDRRPLVAYHAVGGSVLTSTGPAGARVDLTPPRAKVELARGADAALRSDNAVAVTISCSEDCRVDGHATLRTGAGRTTSLGKTSRLLRRGATLTRRFVFDPRKRAGRAGAGTRARVTIRVENASGVSSEKVAELTLGTK